MIQLFYLSIWEQKAVILSVHLGTDSRYFICSSGNRQQIFYLFIWEQTVDILSVHLKKKCVVFYYVLSSSFIFSRGEMILSQIYYRLSHCWLRAHLYHLDLHTPWTVRARQVFTLQSTASLLLPLSTSLTLAQITEEVDHRGAGSKRGWITEGLDHRGVGSQSEHWKRNSQAKSTTSKRQHTLSRQHTWG